MTDLEKKNKKEILNGIVNYVTKYDSCSIELNHEGKKILYLVQFRDGEFQSFVYDIKNTKIIEIHTFADIDYLYNWLEEKAEEISVLKNCVMFWGIVEKMEGKHEKK